jgi:hypothetical protein
MGSGSPNMGNVPERETSAINELWMASPCLLIEEEVFEGMGG